MDLSSYCQGQWDHCINQIKLAYSKEKEGIIEMGKSRQQTFSSGFQVPLDIEPAAFGNPAGEGSCSKYLNTDPSAKVFSAQNIHFILTKDVPVRRVWRSMCSI